MSESEKTTATDAVWPDVPPEPGQVYGFTDPTWARPMVAMHVATWEAIARDVAVMRQRLEQLSEENILMKQGVIPGEVKKKKKLILPS